ncbi:RNA polymerase sigma factor SigJ [Paenibacillus sp. TRM 82003]|nr:RNA polymerase sigma factor SigJ [Kineococcus sp. TRM81007]MCI3921975.1 RNA polymerase sigma factor SigJ [Paenibacillus sp. TRM 82003]
MLGSRAEAEDVVADCWLRLVGADAAERVRDVEAWATVAVARRALDVLRSARSRRESYVGPWLPEPLLTGAAAGDPADRVTLDERVSYALAVVLETLTPAERTAWVLHELFGVPFAEVARVVGRSPAAVRQLASRARARVAAGAARLEVDPAEHRRVTAAFLAAAAGGDLGALLALLDPAVVLTSDGGGVVSAARRSVHGADRVGRFLVGLAGKRLVGATARVVEVNGGAGFAVEGPSGTVLVGVLGVTAGTVRRVDLVLNPAKLPPAAPGARGSEPGGLSPRAPGA